MSHEFPFAGIRVLDLSQGIAGPSAGMMLAQYGANVIKVEPREGDWSRLLGSGKDGMTSLSVTNNLGKRSIALDMKKPAGVQIVQRLAQRADVLLESFRTGVIERLGFGYAQVTQYNPAVIYLSVTGFGQIGPMRTQPATDAILQAFTGMMSINKGAEDQLPHRLECWPIDVITGLYAFQAVAMALYARRDTGRGRYIDTSLMQGAAGLQAVRVIDHVASGGTASVASAFPIGIYRARDGWISLSVLRDSLWVPFCRVIGRLDWAAEPELAAAAGRRARSDEIVAGIHAAFAQQSCEHWCARLREANVLNERVNTYDAFLAHPQPQETGLFTWLEHAVIGRVPHPNVAGFPRHEAGSTRARMPGIGSDSHEVLDELGYAAEEIDALLAQGAVFATQSTPE